jgi:hypothetical protein
MGDGETDVERHTDVSVIGHCYDCDRTVRLNDFWHNKNDFVAMADDDECMKNEGKKEAVLTRLFILY